MSLPRAVAVLAVVVAVVATVVMVAVAVQRESREMSSDGVTSQPRARATGATAPSATEASSAPSAPSDTAASNPLKAAADAVFGVVAHVAGGGDQGPADPTSVVGDSADVWTLSRARVVHPGTAQDAPQGSMTLNRIVRADAVSGAGERMVFTITFTQFEPSMSAPAGTVAGRSYVQGAWRLLPQGSSAGARHPLGEIRGTLSAESDNDILRSGSDFTAAVELLGPQAVGGRGSGGGEYRGSAEFEGRLTLPHVTPVTVSKK